MRLPHNENLLIGIINAKHGGTASCDGWRGWGRGDKGSGWFGMKVAGSMKE